MDEQKKKIILISVAGVVGLLAIVMIARAMFGGSAPAPEVDQAELDRNREIVEDMKEKADDEDTAAVEEFYRGVEEGSGKKTAG